MSGPEKRETRWLTLALIVSTSYCAYAQSKQPKPAHIDVDYEAVLVVEALWNRAAAGDLLTQQGWADATSAGSFTETSDPPKGGSFLVVANRYWITNISREGDKILVPVETAELGRVDSAMRFVATRHENPDFYAYRLVYGPTPMAMWTSDGKQLLKQTVTMTGPNRWRIEGSLRYRWTTLNTAIRYVMDTRDKSTDPSLRANAEKTVEMLRKYR